MTQRKLSAILIPIWVAVLASGATAEPTAKQHFDRGATHYAAGHYDKAAVELRASFEAGHSSRSLFAWAQAERLSGHCDRAVPLYRRLLRRELSAVQTRKARAAMALCEGEESATAGEESTPAGEEPLSPGEPSTTQGQKPGPTATATVPPPAVAVTVGTKSQPSPPTEAPIAAEGQSDHHWIGPVAVGSAGIIALGAGIGLWMSARSEADLAGEATDSASFLEHRDHANSRQSLAGVSVAAGGVLCGAAVAWWFLQDDEPREAENLAMWANGKSGGILVWGRF